MVQRTQQRLQTKGALTEELDQKQPTVNRANERSAAKPEQKVTLGKTRRSQSWRDDPTAKINWPRP